LKIDETSNIHDSVIIGQNPVIMGEVSIKENVIIGNNVVIYPDTIIGKNTQILDNTVLGRKPIAAGKLDRYPKNNLAPLVIGKGCVIGANAVIYRGTRIGSNVLISDLTSVREECLIGNDVVIGRGVLMNYNITIGDGCRIMDGCHFGGDMVLEKDVFLAPCICSVNDNYIGIRKVKNDVDVKRQGAYIEANASIGANVILLAGIRIGRKAVIGAGAVVTKNIPPGKLAYGVPARVIKDVDDILR
jgi:acetyltransferase-like isoleucine patch superfamily enzyme